MRNEYGLIESLKNIISLFYTKINFKKARLIRMPVYIRGKKFIEYEDGLTTGYNCRIEVFSKNKEKKLYIGKNLRIGDNVHIAVAEKMIIGNNVLIGSKVLITDLNHGNYDGKNHKNSNPNIPPYLREIHTSPVLIGDNVWIGDNVCILLGTEIGTGSVIAANSVVNKNVPDNCIVAGSPAKIVKKWNQDKLIWERIV